MNEPSPFPLDPFPRDKAGTINRDAALEEHLLQKIIDGEIPEGVRLPSTAEMAGQLGVSINSLQKALSRLAARGFLTRRTNYGTVVNIRSPKKGQENVFVLFWLDLREEANHFYRRLSRLIEEMLEEKGYNPLIYDQLSRVFAYSSPERRRRQLLADLAHFDPLAVIEIDFILLRFPEVGQARRRPTVSFRPINYDADVSIDRCAIYRELIRVTAENGGRRAIIVSKNPSFSVAVDYLEALWDAARVHEVFIEKILCIEGDRESALEEATEAAVMKELEIWKQLPPGKRFDTLIFPDDIQMRAASLCLLREGISVPDEIRVVSLVNESIDLSVGVPVCGVGLPISKIAQSLVDILEIRLGRSSLRDPAPVLITPERIEVEISSKST